MNKLLGVMVLLAGAVGCGDNLSPDSAFEQEVGADNCDPTVTTSSSGTNVSISIVDGFNAWRSGNTPDVSLSGNSTTCTGVTQFTVTAGGNFNGNPGNQQCSTDYDGSADFSAAANHWHNLIQCDGSTVVVGCQGDASYTAILFVDGSGPNDFSTTVSGTVGAVQDPDEVATGCGECPIGQCVSACQASCPQGDTDCGQCCECWCKEEGRMAGNDACHPQDLCYSGSEGHAVCLQGELPPPPQAP